MKVYSLPTMGSEKHGVLRIKPFSAQKEKVKASWFHISCYPVLDSICSRSPKLVKKNCRALEYRWKLRYYMNMAKKKDIGTAKCFLNSPSAELCLLQRRCIQDTSFSSYSTMRQAIRFTRLMLSGHRRRGRTITISARWWFYEGETLRQQTMWYMKEDPLSGQQTRTQKGVELVLKERGLWPAHDLKLECLKPKCLECQEISDCKVCVKGSRCDSCKTPKVHSNSTVIVAMGELAMLVK